MSVEIPQRALTSQPHRDSHSGTAVISPSTNLISIERQDETSLYVIKNVSDASTSYQLKLIFNKKTHLHALIGVYVAGVVLFHLSQGELSASSLAVLSREQRVALQVSLQEEFQVCVLEDYLVQL